jgi:hypothetical protein
MIVSKMPLEIMKDGPLAKAIERAKTDPIIVHKHKPSAWWNKHNDQKEIIYNQAKKSNQKIIIL